MKTKSNIKKYIILSFGFVVLTFIIYISFLLWKIWPISEYSLNKAGVFGDSFGMLTSFFSGLAFSGMIMTLLMQQEELKLQREELSYTRNEIKGQKEALEKQQKEMEAQNFDNKFFQMLSLLTKVKNDLELDMNRGQKVFNLLKIEIIKNCASKIVIDRNSYITVDSLDKFQNQFKSFNNKYDENFKYYFLNLYQIFNYIDKNSDNEYSLQEYSNIIRAQLSKNELILLFYNGIGMLKIGGNRYKYIIEKYALFEHLTYSDLTNYVEKNNQKIYPNNTLINLLLTAYADSAYGKSDLKKKRNEIAKRLEDNKSLERNI